LYERSGVSEYWVIDPDVESIDVYRRVGQDYRRVAELLLEQHDVLTTPLLAGLDLPLDRIFKD
jgi:Uma2 family endonuclease